jgi:hypothetical protein
MVVGKHGVHNCRWEFNIKMNKEIDWEGVNAICLAQKVHWRTIVNMTVKFQCFIKGGKFIASAQGLCSVELVTSGSILYRCHGTAEHRILCLYVCACTHASIYLGIVRLLLKTCDLVAYTSRYNHSGLSLTKGNVGRLCIHICYGNSLWKIFQLLPLEYRIIMNWLC